MKVKKITSSDFPEIKKGRKEWPFKDLMIDDGVELEDGFNDCDLYLIKAHAHAYGQSVSKQFKTKIYRQTNKPDLIRIIRVG